MLLAYLDPGSGSLIIQVLLGTLAAAWALFRITGRSFLALFWSRDKDLGEGDEVPSIRDAEAQPAKPKQQ